MTIIAKNTGIDKPPQELPLTAVAREEPMAVSRFSLVEEVPDGPEIAQAAAFLEVWFAGCGGSVYFVAMLPDGGHVGECFVRPPYGRRHWNDAALWAGNHSDGGLNVYFSPVTRAPGANRARQCQWGAQQCDRPAHGIDACHRREVA